MDGSTGKGKFDGLVYSGKTATLNNESRVVKVSSGTGETVVFELTEADPSAIPEKGILGFEALKITVPEDMRFFGTSEIKVKVFDVTSGAASDSTLLGTSTTTVSADKNPSDANPVALNNVVFKTETSNVLDTKLHTLKIVAEYHDAYTEAMKAGLYKDDKGYDYTGSSYEGVLDKGYALIGDFEKKVDIRSGVRTVLYGDLNDITDSTENTSDVKFGQYVAKILKAGKTDGSPDDADYDFYSSLEDAVTAFSSNPIIMLGEVRDFGTIEKNVTIDPNGFAVRYLAVSGGAAVTLVRGTGSYRFEGNRSQIAYFRANGDTVEIDTCEVLFTVGSRVSTSTLTVNDGSADIWHTGFVQNLKIVAAANTPASNLGYHVWANVGTSTEVTKGYIDIGQNVGLGTLTLGTVASSGDVLFKGTLTSTVSNIDDIRDGHFKKVGDTSYTSMTANQLAAFKKVVLNANGGTGGAVTLYGIDGMYMNLPSFAATRTTGVTYGNPIFKKSVTVSSGTLNLAFVNWNTETSPSESPTATTAGVSYGDGGKIVVGLKPSDGKTVTNPINLYAQWAKPVGGTIYYVSESNNAYYTFYDADGKQLTFTGTPTVDALATAKSYYVSGKVENAPDRFWVFNPNVNDATKNYKFCKSALTYAPYESYTITNDGVAITYNVEQYECDSANSRTYACGITFPECFRVGTGRGNTEYFMNIGDSGKSGAMYDPANYTASDAGTIWVYVGKLRSGSVANEGCSDWYVPSGGEARKYMDYYVANGGKLSDEVMKNLGYVSSTPSWKSGTDRAGMYFVCNDPNGYGNISDIYCTGVTSKLGAFVVRSF